MAYRKQSLALSAVILSGFLLEAQPVFAHDVIPGVSGFAGRVLHPFIITEHMLCLILAGFIAGIYVRGPIWQSLIVLLMGLAAGFGSQAVIPIIEIIWMLPLGLALAAGLLIVGAVGLGQGLWVGIIFLLGFAVGLETDPEGVFWIDYIQTLGGLMVAGGLLLMALGWMIIRSGRPWMAILVRVVSSWIVAISILVLALNFN